MKTLMQICIAALISPLVYSIIYYSILKEGPWKGISLGFGIVIVFQVMLLFKK